jgi:hypothetical protein
MINVDLNAEDAKTSAPSALKDSFLSLDSEVLTHYRKGKELLG